VRGDRHQLALHESAGAVLGIGQALLQEQDALLEGWNHGVPALVNGGCKVLEGQVRRADGGLYYRSAKEFSAALDWLIASDQPARTLGAQGRAFVDREYRWPVVMARTERLLQEVRARRG
jgi:glycosyltransferase involved in cell wall biosynthesis